MMMMISVFCLCLEAASQFRRVVRLEATLNENKSFVPFDKGEFLIPFDEAESGYGYGE